MMTTAMRARPVSFSVEFEHSNAAGFIQGLRLAYSRRADAEGTAKHTVRPMADGYTVDDSFVVGFAASGGFEDGSGTVAIEVRATSQEAAIRRVTKELAKLGLSD